jgi:hypothetical protein
VSHRAFGQPDPVLIVLADSAGAIPTGPAWTSDNNCQPSFSMTSSDTL